TSGGLDGVKVGLQTLRNDEKSAQTDVQKVLEIAVAKNQLEKGSLDRKSQLKAMTKTVQLCLSTVFRDQSHPLA
ncbi:hypothetical protein MC885_014237, partial [Smutsia gigantea]